MSILAALAARHTDAVFIPECKTGAGGVRRLDAWVLLKTWSPWTTIGYEIKTDRSDFLRDRKWPEYLPVCHELYFVCPAKLIAPEELPADVGLLWTTSGSRLITKRKAVRRKPEPEELLGLMSYALMSRTRIVADMWEARNQETRADFWKRWLVEKTENEDLGRAVSKRVRQLADKAEQRARDAERARERLEGVERRLEELGLSKGSSHWDIERRLGADVLREIKRHAERIVEAANAFEKGAAIA